MFITIDFIGRKWAFKLGILLSIFCLLIFIQIQIIDKSFFPNTSFLYFNFFITYTFQGVFWIYQVEILPPHLIPFSEILANASLIFGVYNFDFSVRLFQFLPWGFSLFGVLCLCFWMVFTMFIETKGKDESWILHEFIKKTNILSIIN